MKKQLLMLVLGVFFVSLQAFAQQKTVTGKVTDDEGLPLPGASISIKGSTTGGTSTRTDGTYSIVANASQVLQFKFIGTKTVNLEYFINKNIDIIIITAIDLDLIDKKLVNKCIFIYQIIYKFYYEFIIDICTTFKQYLLQWTHIIFVNEVFNIVNYKKENAINLINNKIKFNYLIDNDNNKSYFISTINL